MQEGHFTNWKFVWHTIAKPCAREACPPSNPIVSPYYPMLIWNAEKRFFNYVPLLWKGVNEGKFIFLQQFIYNKAKTDNVICSNNVCSAAQSAAGVLQLRVEFDVDWINARSLPTERGIVCRHK